MAAAARAVDDAPHIPVLLRPLLDVAAPVSGTWVDGTFGAGGYARGLIEAGATHVIGIDRDPEAHALASPWIGDYDGRITLKEGRFSELDMLAGEAVDGVVLDLGVSSMQLDQAERGFSFMADGPLDMRMGRTGLSAADICNEADEAELADILYLYGEERASRRIARAIIAARPISTTAQLVEVVERQLPRPKPGQSHPATRSFQALRIAVNEEYQELADGLMAAERALKEGGTLCVVTFHSIEDRMVKRFLQSRAGKSGGPSRHAPAMAATEPAFEILTRKPVAPDAVELAQNSRSRSALLRAARRTAAAAAPVDPRTLGQPTLKRR